MTHGMLKAAVSALQKPDNRSPHDFYPTPPEAVRALLPEIADFPKTIWEPACGDGAIVRELARARYAVFATDLADHGFIQEMMLHTADNMLDYGNVYGETEVDFLLEPTRRADAIVTNPPFGKLAEQFIAKALDLDVPYIAMLTNVNFWHAKSRIALFDRRRPSAIHPLTWRLDFTGSGRPYFNVIWTVWRPRAFGAGRDTAYRPLHRPT